MKKRNDGGPRRWAAVCLAAAVLLGAAACGDGTDRNLLPSEKVSGQVVDLFSPMEKTDPDAENVARTAFDLTVALAEERLGVAVAYQTYTAEDYLDKTYDEVVLDRARNDMDDLYLLNPDTILTLGAEGKLMDLSGLDSAQNLREIIRIANTVDGKLVAIPQEVVAYGLFVNMDLFRRYGLELPNTPEEFLECCRVFQENGIETPVGANRWWLETFVFAQAYADLYNGGNAQAEIDALNSGQARYSDYMRPGFQFLQTLIDRGYIDRSKALVSEAIEGEGADFLAGKTPIVMAYWGAANAETAYGRPEFELRVIGFPSSRGQMPVMPMTGWAVGANGEHAEQAMEVMEVITSDEALALYSQTNRVISPSKNVSVDCIPALEPLNERIEEGVYVLGSNAGMDVEQWGNTCLIVRELLGGATVEECMASFDRLQDAALAAR